ncbi:MAG: glycosyltransferase family 4 protein [Bacteroidales bacterium]|nr:glycosyltransferase family 4 protein [Bacteroidales bacterium]
MKILFVASGNKSVGSVSPFVQSQYDSLCREGLEMILFPVRGKGWKAYARTIPQLRKIILQERPDVVHAHYSVCGILATLATLFSRTKVVVSILGSFPHRNFKRRWVRFCIRHVWDATIVKSQRTADQLGLQLPVIPNGVNLDQFSIIPHDEARRQCGFDGGKKYIVWCSDPARPEKRFDWAEEAVRALEDPKAVLLPVYGRPHNEVARHLCAADVLLLTSVSEGSPNVIKEAMSVNCPIVSTDVGDVSWITRGIEGTYVAPVGDIAALATCIRQALDFGRRTKGRQRIIEYGITTHSIAQKIIKIYDAL